MRKDNFGLSSPGAEGRSSFLALSTSSSWGREGSKRRGRKRKGSTRRFTVLFLWSWVSFHFKRSHLAYDVPK